MGVPPMSDAELFADFLENREVIAALRPFWKQGIRVTIEHSPPHWSDAEPFLVLIERWMLANTLDKHLYTVWKVEGRGHSIAIAAKRAASKASKEEQNRNT